MNFVGLRGWFFIFSALVILPGIVFLIIAPGLKQGIDFTGGSTLPLEFSDPVNQTDLRAELANLGLSRNPKDILDAGKFQVPQTQEFETKMNQEFEQIKAGF